MSDADVLSRPRAAASPGPQAATGPQPQAPAGAEPWTLAGQQLASRLILGTGGVQSLEVLRLVLDASATADAAVACLTGRAPAPEWKPFGPGRFLARQGER